MLGFQIALFIISFSGTAMPCNRECWCDRKKIVGGTDANITEVPYQLALESITKSGFSPVCGASIIGSTWALTAAHCVDRYGAASMRLRAGTDIISKGGIIHSIAHVRIHPKYTPRHVRHDVAVIKVKKEFKFSDSIKAIPLARKVPSVGSLAVVSGWGKLSTFGSNPVQLQKVEVRILGSIACIKAYPSKFTTGMVCAGELVGGKDACQGDSGGPLVSNGELVGIVSWGEGCAQPRKPGVYTDVAHYSDWITSVTEPLEN